MKATPKQDNCYYPNHSFHFSLVNLWNLALHQINEALTDCKYSTDRPIPCDVICFLCCLKLPYVALRKDYKSKLKK